MDLEPDDIRTIVDGCQERWFKRILAAVIGSAFKDGFKPPLYNVWKEQHKANRSGHSGNTHSTWVGNLLWLYTDPFDVVCDPFAGGGSTIDVCKKRFRRYYVSDLTPIVERESEIR